MMELTPSIDSHYFTAGKRYPVYKRSGLDGALGWIKDDRGIDRCVSLNALGQKCPHLWPKDGPSGKDMSYGQWMDAERKLWSEAGHWILLERDGDGPRCSA